VAPDLKYCTLSRRVAPLPDYLNQLLALPRDEVARLPGVLGTAWSCGQHLHALRFCVNELLPLLRSSGEAPRQCHEGSLSLSSITFRRLEERALELSSQLRGLFLPLCIPEEPARLPGVPCMISDGMVIPLSPVADGEARASFIRVGGRCYVPREREARRYAALLGELRRERERRTEEIIRGRPELSRMASQFVGEVTSILDRFGPRDCGGYRLFFRDRDHQLQHSRGHWLLVRGPVAHRMGAGNLFVGLHLIGRTRREWLAVPPSCSPTLQRFWAPDGLPVLGGPCVGVWEQYERLLSNWFTDAEAVVEWIDSGVIRISARSLLHQKRRAARGESPRRRTAAVLRRPPGPC
jgi:hypothetical protein